MQSLFFSGRAASGVLRLSAVAAVTAALFVSTVPASAQNDWVNPDVNALRDEVSRLRNDLSTLSGGALGGSGGFQGTGTLSTDSVVRVGQLENQLRSLIGRLEQVEFQMRQLEGARASELEAMRYRLEAIEGRLSIDPGVQVGQSGQGAVAPTADGVGQSYQLSQRPVDGSGQPSIQPTAPGGQSGALGGGVVGQPLGVTDQNGVNRAQPPALIDQNAAVQGSQGAAPAINQTINQSTGQSFGQSPGQAARQQQLGETQAASPFSGCEVDATGAIRCPENQVASAQPQTPAPQPQTPAPQSVGPAAAGTLGVIPGQNAPGAGAQAPLFEQGGVGGADQSFERGVAQVRAGAFDDAERDLRNFVSEYPEDDRVGDAKYWIGETHYVRGQFAEAARVFLDAYRGHPGASRAPDSLLKLGMTFSQLNQVEEACLTFREVNNRFPGAPKNVLDRAKIESRRVGCE